jgi:hypothetical protein
MYSGFAVKLNRTTVRIFTLAQEISSEEKLVSTVWVAQKPCKLL